MLSIFIQDTSSTWLSRLDTYSNKSTKTGENRKVVGLIFITGHWNWDDFMQWLINKNLYTHYDEKIIRSNDTIWVPSLGATTFPSWISASLKPGALCSKTISAVCWSKHIPGIYVMLFHSVVVNLIISSWMFVEFSTTNQLFNFYMANFYRISMIQRNLHLIYLITWEAWYTWKWIFLRHAMCGRYSFRFMNSFTRCQGLMNGTFTFWLKIEKQGSVPNPDSTSAGLPIVV